MKSETLIHKPWIRYALGADRVVLFGDIPHGNGSRAVAVQVKPQELIRLSRYLAPVLDSEHPQVRSHAFWHFQNSEREYPCLSCPKHVQDAAPKLVRVEPKALPASKLERVDASADICMEEKILREMLAKANSLEAVAITTALKLFAEARSTPAGPILSEELHRAEERIEQLKKALATVQGRLMGASQALHAFQHEQQHCVWSGCTEETCEGDREAVGLPKPETTPSPACRCTECDDHTGRYLDPSHGCSRNAGCACPHKGCQAS